MTRQPPETTHPGTCACHDEPKEPCVLCGGYSVPCPPECPRYAVPHVVATTSPPPDLTSPSGGGRVWRLALDKIKEQVAEVKARGTPRPLDPLLDWPIAEMAGAMHEVYSRPVEKASCFPLDRRLVPGVALAAYMLFGRDRIQRDIADNENAVIDAMVTRARAENPSPGVAEASVATQLVAVYAEENPPLRAICRQVVRLATLAPEAVLVAMETHPLVERIEPLVYAVGLVGGWWIPANEIVREMGEMILREARVEVPEFSTLRNRRNKTNRRTRR